MTTQTARTALAIAAATALLIPRATLHAQTSDAQSDTAVAAAAPADAAAARWNFSINSGTVMPTGAQRDVLKRGKLTAAQLSYSVRPAVALMATVGWARSRDIATDGDPRLDVFTYDVGAEARAKDPLPHERLSLVPFIGAGAGGRSYNYRKLDIDATHNIAAYASGGAELGIHRVTLRVEARDYVTGFKPLIGGGAADARNDVAVMFGLRIAGL